MLDSEGKSEPFSFRSYQKKVQNAKNVKTICSLVHWCSQARKPDLRDS